MRQESPTLDLANDCSRFVIRHFEIINTSSPHIYHSALTLTPRESIVRKLYKSHAHPLVRVVYGLPASWDSKAAAAFDSFVDRAVWSPCNRFIAIESNSAVDVLDSATLQRIQRLNLPSEFSLKAIAFSPGGRMLTAFANDGHRGTRGTLVSWDLQTGGVVSTVEWKGPGNSEIWSAQITYSMNGTMVAVLSQDLESSTISIHNVISGISMPSISDVPPTDPDLDPRILYAHKLWTHGESFRFETREPTGITIWEARSGAAATDVESVSVPRNQFDIALFEFHPASHRLAFIDNTGGALIVWDARASESLLCHTGIHFLSFMSFSPDARCFACTTNDSQIYLWKESPTGYTLLERLAPGFGFPHHSFSPNGESIIAFGSHTIHLWHTKNLTTTTSSISAPAPPCDNHEAFILDFIPNSPLVVFTRKKDERVTVLDIKSGAPQSTIDTPMMVYGLRSIENTIVVIGREEIVAWNLPGGDFLPDVRMDVAWITYLDCLELGARVTASISSDFRCVAFSTLDEYGGKLLEVCYPATGHNPNVEVEDESAGLWFAPGGHDIWCVTQDGEAQVFTFTQDALDHTDSVADIEDGQWGCPWGSQLGYKVTDDGWILGASGKRLFMLPPLWQSPRKVERVWNGKFVALLHGHLPELVILEVEP